MAADAAVADPVCVMISTNKWLQMVAMSALCWQECNENPFAFCYRMGWTLISTLQERAGGGPGSELASFVEPAK